MITLYSSKHLDLLEPKYAFETFNEEFQLNKYFASIGDSKHHPYLTITFSNHSVFLLTEKMLK